MAVRVLAGTLDARGLTEQGRVNAEGGGGAAVARAAPEKPSRTRQSEMRCARPSPSSLLNDEDAKTSRGISAVNTNNLGPPRFDGRLSNAAFSGASRKRHPASR